MSQDFPGATESMNEALNLNGDVDRIRAFYDRWAADYDQDVLREYGSPSMAVNMIRETAARTNRPDLLAPEVHVVDAGCGTGLVGAALHEGGWRNVHGLDLSAAMIEQAAERGIYRSLQGDFDLTAPIPTELYQAATVVTVIGVFTSGHVPPGALRNIAHLVAPGGVLVVSTRSAYLESTDYEDVSRSMVEAGDLELLHRVDNAPYTMDSVGTYWAYLQPH